MMKKRRAPVQSVLAERKMFAGGGMLPISRPMEEKQPSGILASSEPLIDAVAQEVLAPMTGGPLTMAEGGSVMREPAVLDTSQRQSQRPGMAGLSGMLSSSFFGPQFRPYGGGVMAQIEEVGDELSGIGEQIERVGGYADQRAKSLARGFGRQLDNYANTVQGQLGTSGYTNRFMDDRRFGFSLFGKQQSLLPPDFDQRSQPKSDQFSDGFPQPQRMNQGGIAQLRAGGMPMRSRSSDLPEGIRISLVPTLTPTGGSSGPFEMTTGDILDETAAEKAKRIVPLPGYREDLVKKDRPSFEERYPEFAEDYKVKYKTAPNIVPL